MKYDVNNNADTAAFHTATKASVYGVRLLSCYVAPSFREISSKAHTDTFQFSGDSAYSNMKIENAIMFGSTNSAAQIGTANRYNFIRTLIIGSKATCLRYPVPPGADGYSVGYIILKGVNGAATNATAIDSILIGSIGSTDSIMDYRNIFFCIKAIRDRFYLSSNKKLNPNSIRRKVK